MKRKLVLFLTGLILSSIPSFAQKFSLSTDLLGYACLGTLNADASYAVSQKWSLTAGVRDNPFVFNADSPGRQFQLKQRSCSFGARLWPWHTASGWWMASKIRWQEYNMGGILRRESQDGNRYGAGLYAGYTHMLTPHLNIEFGLGLWAGMDMYRKFSCPPCGYLVQSGKAFFLLPDDISVSLAYVF